MCSGRSKKKTVGGTTARRRKRRDFDAVYTYMGVYNRSGGNPPVPQVIRAVLVFMLRLAAFGAK